MLFLNGKKIDKYSTLKNLIEGNNYNLDNIAVLLNGKVIKKKKWGKIKLKKGDVIEVVGFVGGG